MKNDIDFVITWVDETDTNWQKERDRCFQTYSAAAGKGTDLSAANGAQCYRSWDTLRYWFRGVEQFAPWVHRIFFVTSGPVPDWLDITHPKLKIVRHGEFIPDEYLPTFNSIAIEWNLDRLPGLAERFVYFNDDMFLLRKVKPSAFFKRGLPRDIAGMAVCVNRFDQGREELNNTRVISEFFEKKDVLRSHRRKWFRLAYRDVLLRTLLLLPWKEFSGFYEPHGSCAYRRSCFEAVKAAVPELVDEACRQPFRNRDSINHWLVRDWQLVTGQFCPRGAGFHKAFYEYSEAVPEAIRRQLYSTICINDSPTLSGASFEAAKREVREAMEALFPNRSSFETE